MTHSGKPRAFRYTSRFITYPEIKLKPKTWFHHQGGGVACKEVLLDRALVAPSSLRGESISHTLLN
jgi:hypothetical protein